MKTTRIALVSLLVAVVSSCTSPPRDEYVTFNTPQGEVRVRSSNVKTCHTASCHLDVTVTGPASSCTAEVEAKVLKLTRVGRVNIQWRIVSKEGEFVQQAGPRDGIRPHPPTMLDGRAPGRNVFQWHVDNPARPAILVETYDINTEINGTPCRTLDPYIMN